MGRELNQGTAYSKLGRGDSFSASEEQQDQASGLCWESRGQSVKQGGPEQDPLSLQFVLCTVESRLRGFVFCLLRQGLYVEKGGWPLPSDSLTATS